ncbi:MAG: Spy/CpxP family protein refolding chaperone [Candidatus Auribacterota bacterium]
MKMRSMVLATVTAAVLFLSTALYAGHGCQKCGGKGDGYGKDSIEDKFFKKVHFIVENQDELGISDEQIAQIKKLKYDTKKAIISAEADIEIAAMDIKAALYEDAVDIPSVMALVDKKYEVKKEKSKTIISAYIGLKNMLTPEQKDKMKELWKACKKAKCPVK